jgi:hypothetical protein
MQTSTAGRAIGGSFQQLKLDGKTSNCANEAAVDI